MKSLIETVADRHTATGPVDFGATLAFVEGVDAVDSPHDLVSVVKECERLANHVEALRYAAIHRLHLTYAGQKSDDEDDLDVQALDDAGRIVSCELEAALGITKTRATTLLTRSYRLADQPDLLEATCAGDVSISKADILLEGIDSLVDPAHRRTLLDEVLPEAAASTHPQLRERIETRAVQLDPAAAKRRRVTRVRNRALRLTGRVDSVADLQILGYPVERLKLAFDEIDRLARRAYAARAEDDERTVAQLRCDIAVARLLGDAVFTADCGHGDAEGSDDTGHPRQGCECRRGGRCRCGCGLTYADPAEVHRCATDDAPARPRPPDDEPDEPWWAHGDAPPPDGGANDRPAPSTHNDASPGYTDDRGCPATECPPLPDPASAAALHDDGPAMPAGTSRVLLTIPLDRLVALLHVLDDHANCPPDAPCRDAGDNTVYGADDGRDPLTPPSVLPEPGMVCPGASTPSGSGLSLPGYGQVSEQPARLAGYGPLADEVALRMLRHHLDRPHPEQALVITGADGQVVGYHKLDRRTLTGLRRDALAAASGSCVFPTCRCSPTECQADHSIAYARLRRTLLADMNLVCTPHHAAKSAGAYRIAPVSPGTWELIMRSGHRYRTQRPQYN